MASHSQTYDCDARTKLLGILKERQQLREQLELANVAICELENQNILLDRLLTKACTIERIKRTKPTTKSLLKTYIGPWECSSSEYPALLAVENLFRNGKRQKALNSMPRLLARKDLDDRTRVNAKLLYAALIQSTGRNIRQALMLAEGALASASELQIHDLAGKANYWRGLCHLCLEEWANAKWCFILASNLHGHTEQVEAGRTTVERELLHLPEDQRKVTADFQFFCSLAMEDFIRHGY